MMESGSRLLVRLFLAFEKTFLVPFLAVRWQQYAFLKFDQNCQITRLTLGLFAEEDRSFQKKPKFVRQNRISVTKVAKKRYSFFKTITKVRFHKRNITKSILIEQNGELKLLYFI